jgi:hypothetical protein
MKINTKVYYKMKIDINMMNQENRCLRRTRKEGRSEGRKEQRKGCGDREVSSEQRIKIKQKKAPLTDRSKVKPAQACQEDRDDSRS